MPDAERLVTGRTGRPWPCNRMPCSNRGRPERTLLPSPRPSDCRSNMDGRQGWVYISINHFCFYSYVMGEEKKIIIPFTGVA